MDKIDFTKYKFNFRESMEIIQGYNYRRDIIEQDLYLLKVFFGRINVSLKDIISF